LITSFIEQILTGTPPDLERSSIPELNPAAQSRLPPSV
jgi:hypothetical protein